MRKKLLNIFLTTTLVTVCGYLFVNSYKYSLCFSDLITNTYDVECSILLERIGLPLFMWGVATSFVFLILILIPSAYSSWKKFGVWAIPLMTFVFAVYKGPSGGFMDVAPHPEIVFILIGFAYVLISLVAIIFSVYKKRTHKLSREKV